MTERPLPYSTDHEHGLLSCCIQEPLLCGREALDVFGAECPFYLPACALIWSAFVRIDLDKIDALVISDFLGERLNMQELLDIQRAQPHTANFKTSLDWCRKLHAQRKLIATLTTTTSALYDTKASPDDIVQEMRTSVGDAICDSKEMVDVAQSVDELDADMARDDIGSGTGFWRLNRLLEPMWPGSVIVIGARLGVGKTTLGMNMALNLAAEGKRVGIMSMEMTHKQLTARWISSLALTSSRPADLRSAWNTDRVVQARRGLKMLEQRIHIDDTTNDWNKIKRAIKREHARTGCKHWFIDYLGLIQVPGTSKNAARDQVIAKITGEAKTLAKEIGGWIFEIAQVNRAGDGAPQTKHLADSDAVGRDADAVLLINYKKDDTYAEYNRLQQGGCIEATIMVDKNRFGPTGPVMVPFHPSYSLFSNAIAQDKEIQA